MTVMRALQPLRSTARHLALSAGAAAARWSGRTRAALRRPRVQIYLLHQVPEAEAGRFRAILHALAEDHTFIGYADAVDRIRTGRIDAPYVAFSFDDGLESCLVAARALAEFDVTGCYFVCPSMIGETDPAKVAAFCRDRLHIPPRPFMTWDDVETLVGGGGEIGNHTMHHVNLAQISAAEAVDEITTARDELIRRLGRADHFAWPYGGFDQIDQAAAAAVFDAGHESCASGVRGSHGPGPAGTRTRPCLRRDLVVAGSPASHALYFTVRSSRARAPDLARWPGRWFEEERPCG